MAPKTASSSFRPALQAAPQQQQDTEPAVESEPVAPPPSPVEASTPKSIVSQKNEDRMEKFRKGSRIFCNLFPVWTLLTAATALARPSTFLKIPPSTFPAQIGMLMLCMGISLKPSDFGRVAQRPAAVGLAFVGCYGIVSGLRGLDLDLDDPRVIKFLFSLTKCISYGSRFVVE